LCFVATELSDVAEVLHKSKLGTKSKTEVRE
jgi:hypothetical protein